MGCPVYVRECVHSPEQVDTAIPIDIRHTPSVRTDFILAICTMQVLCVRTRSAPREVDIYLVPVSWYQRGIVPCQEPVL